jgi:hypothetical protein
VRLLLSTLALGWFLCMPTGCVHPVFNEPTTISTKAIAAAGARPISPVSATSTSVVVLIIPIIPDPRNVYDELLEKAKEAGGNAVIDVQVRNKSFFFSLPGIFVQRTEVVGTAASIGSSLPSRTRSPTRR